MNLHECSDAISGIRARASNLVYLLQQCRSGASAELALILIHEAEKLEAVIMLLEELADYDPDTAAYAARPTVPRPTGSRPARSDIDSPRPNPPENAPARSVFTRFEGMGPLPEEYDEENDEETDEENDGYAPEDALEDDGGEDAEPAEGRPSDDA